MSVTEKLFQKGMVIVTIKLNSTVKCNRCKKNLKASTEPVKQNPINSDTMNTDKHY